MGFGDGVSIALYMPEKFIFADKKGEIKIYWKGNKDITNYHFIISTATDSGFADVFQTVVSDTAFVLKPLALNLESGTTYSYYVKAMNNEITFSSPTFEFTLASPEKATQMREQADRIIIANITEEEHLAYLMLAYYFDSEQAFAESYIAYQTALSHKPDDKLLKKSFALFLAKSNRLDEAKKYWEE